MTYIVVLHTIDVRFVYLKSNINRTLWISRLIHKSRLCVHRIWMRFILQKVNVHSRNKRYDNIMTCVSLHTWNRSVLTCHMAIVTSGSLYRPPTSHTGRSLLLTRKYERRWLTLVQLSVSDRAPLPQNRVSRESRCTWSDTMQNWLTMYRIFEMFMSRENVLHMAKKKYLLSSGVDLIYNINKFILNGHKWFTRNMILL